MLKSLFIKNYVLIDQLDLDFAEGFHVFTGETGAGKSIIVGALSLILGNRADYSVIRNTDKKCEISAIFDISQNQAAQQWLTEQDIDHHEEIECRRVISADGRSKSWLNARPCNNTSLKHIGSLLVQIHGQHDQIKLHNSKYQLSIIDDAGQYQDLQNTVSQLAHDWQQVNKDLKNIELAGALNEADSQLLRYQLDELLQLNLTENELDDLHTQQKALTGAVGTLNNIEHSISLLNGDHNNSNLSHNIAEIINLLSDIDSIDMNEILSMLDEVSINLNEIESQLQSTHENIEVNPEKLHTVENRLESIYQMARKHQVNAEMLYQHQLELANKLQLNDSQKSQRQQLIKKQQTLVKQYQKHALMLFKARQKTAEIFQKNVTNVIQQMGLGKAEFMVEMSHDDEISINPHGQDICHFTVRMNVGQSAQKMSATASGGELSRIALAIEICKKHDAQSTSFVFDEVDSGIGGAVAETVGKLMRKLSNNQQVFAVTHLPHVAGLAHQHYQVSKTEVKNNTVSQVTLLNQPQRIDELARMLGGSQITEATRQQAQSFISASNS